MKENLTAAFDGGAASGAIAECDGSVNCLPSAFTVSALSGLRRWLDRISSCATMASGITN